MRLIDADALMEAFEDLFYNDVDDQERTERLIDNAPTVDTEITVEQAVSKIQETDLLSKHDKILKEWADMKCEYCNKNVRPQGAWIAVKDKLPDTDGFYLVFLENEQMVVAHSDGIIANHDYGPKILAWQPLPEAYKKGGAE